MEKNLYKEIESQKIALTRHGGLKNLKKGTIWVVLCRIRNGILVATLNYENGSQNISIIGHFVVSKKRRLVNEETNSLRYPDLEIDIPPKVKVKLFIHFLLL